MSDIKIHPNERGGYTVEVDGHDISHLVVADGIAIDFRHADHSTMHEGPQPHVVITLGEGVDVDLELPAALASIVTPTADEGTTP